jgi:hypothetical protein
MNADEEDEENSRRAENFVKGFAFIGFNPRNRRESEPSADTGK